MPLEDGEWEDEALQGTTIPIAEEADLGVESPGPGGIAPPTEPQPTTQTEESTSAGIDPDEPLPEFDPQFRQDFEGLLYIGRLTRDFHWMGHKFVIRTLMTSDLLEVGLLTRQYVGTVADAKAYQAAMVAACVVSVDGKSLPMPITDEKADTELLNRFNYVRDHWFPPTLDAVYQEYLILESQVDEVIQAMAKAHG